MAHYLNKQIQRQSLTFKIVDWYRTNNTPSLSSATQTKTRKNSSTCYI